MDKNTENPKLQIADTNDVQAISERLMKTNAEAYTTLAQAQGECVKSESKVTGTTALRLP